MGRQAWAIGTLILLLCVGASGMVSANTDSTYEPGFIEWEINPLERLFVEGSDVEEAVLQREQTDSAVGGFGGSDQWTRTRLHAPKPPGGTTR